MSLKFTRTYHQSQNLLDQQQIGSNEDICDLSNQPLAEVEIHTSSEEHVSQITEMERKRLRFAFPGVYNLTLLPFKKVAKVTKPPSKFTDSSDQSTLNRADDEIVDQGKCGSSESNVEEMEYENDLHGYQESFENLMILDTKRFDFLKNCPYLFSEYRNSRNMEALSSLIRDACSENCVLKTPSFSSPLEGRHFIVELMESLFRSVPDNKMEIQSVRISNDKKLITTVYIGTGRQ